MELAADQVLIDDLKTRTVAAQRGLAVAGTLGVLLAASSRGLINLPQAAARLRQTSFRAAPAVWNKILGPAGLGP